MTSNQQTVINVALVVLLAWIVLLYLGGSQAGQSGFAIAASILLGSLLIAAAIFISRK